MADDSQVIRGINWRETFPVTHVFRAFRVAIEPSKLFLALVALILLLAGGLFLDAIWPASYSAVNGEIYRFSEMSYQGHGGREFNAWRDDQLKASRDRYSALQLQTGIAKTKAEADGYALREEHFDGMITILSDRVNADNAAIAAAKEPYEKVAMQSQADTDIKTLDEARGLLHKRGLFREFFSFQTADVFRVINGVRVNNWMGGIGSHEDDSGVVASAIGFFTIAPLWAITHHPFFFVLYGVYFLVIWAVFGGAISRIAAVQIAREEKLSIRTALRFSMGKFLSYAFAPVIPLLIILFVGLLVALASLLGNIPWIGPVVVGAFFFLALAAGFVTTLVLIGTVGGLNLMYATVAVEGSDSFDAISRSFSYVYAKPWRMLFYTLVAVLYGSLTFLFVRFFIQTMLALAHAFVGWGLFWHVGGGNETLWQAMWPYSPARLYYQPDWSSLNWDQKTGAALIWCWVMLCLALLGAFAISFYFSANTIIYYLMRREVDATELDDVYVEQSDEDLADPVPATDPTPASSPAAATPPTDPAPPPTEPAAPATDVPPATT